MTEELPTEQLAAIERVTGKYGIYQHVDKEEQPIIREESQHEPKRYAYSSDDQARLMEAQCKYQHLFKNQWFKKTLPKILINYVIEASKNGEAGLINNYMMENGEVIRERPGGLLDVLGRWMNGLVELASSKQKLAGEAEKIYDEKVEVVGDMILQCESPHAVAYAANAFAKRIKYLGIGLKTRRETLMLIDLIDKLKRKYQENRIKKKDKWNWPEDKITYCSGKIPQAFLSASEVLERNDLKKMGLEMLNFLIKESFQKDMFWPPGNKPNFYERGKEKPKYDQQPCEAIIALALQQAYTSTWDDRYLNRRTDVLNWFRGTNSKNVSLLTKTGGINDAITEEGVNENQGAEPRLVHLLCESTRFA